MAEKYNGWTNYETWNVALWLDNDEPNYRRWQAEAKECWDDAEADKILTRLERATFDLGERLKADIEGENQPELDGCYGDLLQAALSEVDWDEIAEHYLEDIAKEAEEVTEAG